jgi:hypothetical protein
MPEDPRAQYRKQALRIQREKPHPSLGAAVETVHRARANVGSNITFEKITGSWNLPRAREPSVSHSEGNEAYPRAPVKLLYFE